MVLTGRIPQQLEVVEISWVIGIGIALLVIVYLAMELATNEDKGMNIRSYIKAYKKSLLFICIFFIPLIVISGIIYYTFL
ncbi:DUF624 domain-containing protein [Evansella sp. AB-rgal1]|uniref:DUF624 domain-containing protein n=1 Tax=Evansella sp. AB-rgal1 TaxID=3242696 RepID=UPI00359F12C8